MLAPAVIDDVVEDLPADIEVVDIVVFNDDMTKPKNPDIYFILFKPKINVIKIPYNVNFLREC